MKSIEVKLSKKDRKALKHFSEKGVHSIRLVTRAKIILELDSADGRTETKQKDIEAKLDVSRQTIYNAKKDFLAAKSVSAFLKRKKPATPPITPKVTGEVEAHIIALACSTPPEGYANWTLWLLADKSVELRYIDAISPATVGRLLKKRNLSHTLRPAGASRPPRTKTTALS